MATAASHSRNPWRAEADGTTCARRFARGNRQAVSVSQMRCGGQLLRRHGRAWPGHPRLACGTKDVDARHKAGHDGVYRAVAAQTSRPAAAQDQLARVGKIE